MRNAATVILLRDSAAGAQVFMMRRHLDARFVGGAYVFPGGVLNESDNIDESLCSGLSDSQASEILGLNSGGLAYWVAAIRECFEESGILLAYGPDGRILNPNRSVAARLDEYRRAIHANSVTIDDLARRENLKLATDRVFYWAHWITPDGQPRRFDTRFFLAIAPEGQLAAHDGRELTDSTWITSASALEKAKTREWIMVFATMHNLIRIKEYGSVQAIEAAARTPRRVGTLQPRVARVDGGFCMLIPGDEGYEGAVPSAAVTNAELADASWRRVERENAW